jgi:hypothetical protein
MSVAQERRIYITFEDEAAATNIKKTAQAKKLSASKYIVGRLELLDKVEQNPVGAELIKYINGDN